jgi:uncharacterized protein (DUF2141 family)
MRLTSILAAICALVISPGCSVLDLTEDRAEEGDLSLRIVIHAKRPLTGTLRIALYNHSSAWQHNEGLTRGRIIMLSAETEILDIHGLSPGHYAVAIHNDRNQNLKMDKYMYLFPREPWGFSNDAGRFGKPSFEKAAFDLQDNHQIEINLMSMRGS